MSKFQEGYYWVKIREEYPWEVAYYRRGKFGVTEQHQTYSEKDIHKVHPERIKSPDEVDANNILLSPDAEWFRTEQPE